MLKKLRKIGKLIVTGVLSAVMAVGVVGCAGEKPSNGQTLTVWVAGGLDANYRANINKPNSGKAKLTKWLVETFESQNEGVKLMLLDKGWGTALSENFVSVQGTKSAPDVIPGEVDFPLFAEAGRFLDITDEVQDILPDLAASAQVPATLNGRTYGLSSSMSSLGLVVNKSALKQAEIINDKGETINQTLLQGRIDPLKPATFEDLLTICKEIQKKKPNTAIVMNAVKGYSAAFRALGYMRAAGGEILDGDEIVINSAANKRALELMREFAQYAPVGTTDSSLTDSQLVQKVLNGFAAYTIDNCDFYTWASVQDDIVTAEIPQFADRVNEKRSNVLIGNCMYGVVSSTKNKDAAIKFVKFIASEEYQLKAAEYNSSIPSNLKVMNSDAYKQTKNYESLIPYLAPFNTNRYETFSGLPAFKKNSTAMWNELSTLIEKVLMGNVNGSVSNLLSAAESKMKEYNA